MANILQAQTAVGPAWLKTSKPSNHEHRWNFWWESLTLLWFSGASLLTSNVWSTSKVHHWYMQTWPLRKFTPTHFFGFHILGFTVLHAKVQSHIFAYPELLMLAAELLKHWQRTIQNDLKFRGFRPKTFLSMLGFYQRFKKKTRAIRRTHLKNNPTWLYTSMTLAPMAAEVGDFNTHHFEILFWSSKAGYGEKTSPECQWVCSV